ncbi:L-glyceraldehyde 3-phosphate reductase [Rubellicoccus peritrichatus]|uniref:L-glyceraldehyde 3-phosphate reductase n=1 Tax=Rubellicoccus peritrichatus TaxID=3080537 RepID=A0AAQ3LF53_9BACT|nr:L-glyceraldehyde 3-phosphate reductase [Puniceicoccus sp. CR14]WOO42775.1 L-glyceraldehyde 3-phosphate reductase [Puniceicoccus sp. CR14]
MPHKANPERYSSMHYNRCGRSGLRLPRLSLGLWHNFGDVDVYTSIREILLSAFDRGITHIDLANNYGPPPGSAESNFGKVLKNDLGAYRDELVISTKAGYLMWPGPYGEWGSRKYLLASLDQSLKRMDIDYVDIFYSHRFDPDTPLEETMGALAHAVKSGKALYAGISNYSPEQTTEAARLLREMGAPCLIHQPVYNMLNRWIEDGLTKVLDEEGIGCIPFSPLAQGMLTKRYLKDIPEDSRAAKSHGFLKEKAVQDNLPKIKALNDIAEQRGQSLAAMALSWIMRLPQVTSVLIGASSVTQLDQNLEAINAAPLNETELDAIDIILK